MTETASLTALDNVIANRAWLHRAHPFPHVVAQDVFTVGFYTALADQVGAILGRGLSDTPAAGRFSRGMRGYDAYGLGVTEDLGGPAALFISPAWRDLMCGLFGVERTPYVFAGAHHHAPWGKDGFIHTDYNPVWFPRTDSDGIQVPDQASCDFKTGSGRLADGEKIETIRGAVVIYYLLNDGWQAGDGGETGLFTGLDGVHDDPAARCAPVNNSLVAFECTPGSFHAYLANRARPRTSIIMWVHRGLAEAVERHGEERIERWR